MFRIRKILVPVNFTEPCRQAAHFAVELASGWDAQVCLLHVFEATGSAIGFESPWMMEESVSAQREQACVELQKFITVADSRSLQRTVLEGEPATNIARFARNEKFDLILMPTRGFGIFRRLLIGSVTAKVLHDADCPVWTGVHPEATTADGVISIRKIACAVDLGRQSRSALDWASLLADHWKAALSVIHVLPSVPEASWRDSLERIARQQVATMIEDCRTWAEVHIRFGTVPSGVSEALEDLSPDLVVIGRGSGSSGGRLHGDAYAIIRDASCPVISI